MQSPINKENTSDRLLPPPSPSKRDRSRTSSNDPPFSSIQKEAPKAESSLRVSLSEMIDQLETKEGNASAEMVKKINSTLKSLSPVFFHGVFPNLKKSGVETLVHVLKSKIKPGQLNETDPLPEHDYRDLANHLIRTAVDKVYKSLDSLKNSLDIAHNRFKINSLSEEQAGNSLNRFLLYQDSAKAGASGVLDPLASLNRFETLLSKGPSQTELEMNDSLRFLFIAQLLLFKEHELTEISPDGSKGTITLASRCEKPEQKQLLLHLILEMASAPNGLFELEQLSKGMLEAPLSGEALDEALKGALPSRRAKDDGALNSSKGTADGNSGRKQAVEDLQLEQEKASKDQEVVEKGPKGGLFGREGESSTLASTLASLESNSKPSSNNEANIEGSRAPSHSSSDSRIDHKSSPTSTSRATGGTGGNLVERSSKLEKAGKDGNDGRDGRDNQASRTETRDESRDVNATFETPNVTSAASPSATSTQVATQPTTRPTENAVPQTPKDSKRSREPGSSGNKRPSKKLELSFSAPDPDEDPNTSFCGPSISSQGGALTHHRQATGKGMDCEESDANSSMVDDSSFDGASILTHGHHLGSVDSTVAASSQDQEAHRNVPASHSKSLSSNGNAPSTSTSGSTPHQGQQPVKGATDKASSKSTDSAKGTPFTAAHSASGEKNLPSRPATNSGIEGRSKAAEDDGNDVPTLDSTSKAGFLTANQNETTASLPASATQPTRGETDTPSLSPSNSTSEVGMTTFNTSGSMSIFDSRAPPLSTSSLASMVSQGSSIEGGDEEQDEIKAPIVKPSPTSTATEGGVEGKVGKIEGFEDGKKSDSKVEDSEAAKRENVSGGTAKSVLRKEEYTERFTPQGSKNLGLNHKIGYNSDEEKRINDFKASSRPSYQERQASYQDLPVVGAYPDPHDSDVAREEIPVSQDGESIDKYYAQYSNDSPPPNTFVSKAGLLSRFVEAIENHLVLSLTEFRNGWAQLEVDILIGMIQAQVNQLLSDAKKDSDNILLGNPTVLDKKDLTLPESEEEAEISFYEWDQLKRVDSEVRKALLGLLQRNRSAVSEMDEHEALLEGIEVADVLYERTLNVLDNHILNLRIMERIELRS